MMGEMQRVQSCLMKSTHKIHKNRLSTVVKKQKQGIYNYTQELRFLDKFRSVTGCTFQAQIASQIITIFPRNDSQN